MEYRVKWEIDIDADSPVEAAREARAIQLGSSSMASVFKVRCVGGHPAYYYRVDLDQEGHGNGK